MKQYFFCFRCWPEAESLLLWLEPGRAAKDKEVAVRDEEVER